MEAKLPGNALKTMSRFLKCLLRVGDDLFIEARPGKIQLSTLNASKSAFALFNFAPKFFDYYAVTGNINKLPASAEPFVMCKVLLKPVYAIFRQKESAQKAVDYCTLRIEHQGTEPKLIIQLHCQHDVLKTFKLNYAVCEAVHAVYSKHQAPNRWTASPQVFGDWLGYFQARQDELTLQYSQDKILMKSFSERLDEFGKSTAAVELQTIVSLNAEDYDVFELQHDTELTFNLKEFKAFLSFAETVSQPISAYFEHGGLPIVFSVQVGDFFVGDIVLATVADQVPLPAALTPAATPAAAVADVARQAFQDLQADDGLDAAGPPTPQAPPRNPTSQHSHLATSQQRGRSQVSAPGDITASGRSTITSVDQHHDFPYFSSAQRSSPRPDIAGPKLGQSVTSQQHSSSASSPPEVGVPALDSRAQLFSKVNEASAALDEEDEEQEDVIPSTPPPKRVRRLFE